MEWREPAALCRQERRQDSARRRPMARQGRQQVRDRHHRQQDRARHSGRRQDGGDRLVGRVPRARFDESNHLIFVMPALVTVIQGVLLGGLYALFAAGLSLIFGIMRLVNLAHGDLIVLAAFVILGAAHALGLGVFTATAVALPLMLAVGMMPLVTFVSAVAVILLLNVLFYSTALGRAFRATSDDADIAQLMGIETRRVFAMAMAVAMVVVTIAALYLGMRATFDPTIGPARLLYAFEAVIIGGLGSLWGTLAGGVIIGVAQTVGANINPEWQILAGHLAFLAVLMLRPRGLFPRTAD